ncbi:hypothetical protein NEFER03_1670 [Nematocida sp. LUAm3]|nr:hypothetical protein NEFER03_1670 [Nematocida sp. LUAm3]KAI5175660.1 hypothetical protein NEFER02_1547 [Nematocida sp. LUAm2]KAI5178566.1 hypothetical protein NEFER01_1702 [Nematocida sp. LUAm1]
MIYSVCAAVKDVPINEDILREGSFAQAVQASVKQIEKIKGIHIPLEIAPGKRVKSKKEMREIEAPAVESRKTQKVKAPKQKRNVEVVDRISNMVESAKDNMRHQRDAKPTKRKEKRKQKPGKSKRMKRR